MPDDHTQANIFAFALVAVALTPFVPAIVVCAAVGHGVEALAKTLADDGNSSHHPGPSHHPVSEGGESDEEPQESKPSAEKPHSPPLSGEKPSADSDSPLFVGEEKPHESKPQFKPNFVKFVISTSSSKPYQHFLSNVQGKAKIEQWKAAIRLYSGNSVYAQMNQALRHDDATGLQEYGSLINLTMQPFGLSAMKTHSVLKPFVGTVWRGCSLSSSDLKKYKVGEVVLWEAFSSTSTMSSSAFRGNVVFEIHCNKALEVQKGDEHELKDLSSDLIVPAQIHHLSQYPNENEVLYPPYTKFRIVSRTDKTSVTNVVLETMEFPSLSLLVKEGKWEEVKKGLDARQKHSDASSPAWFTQHASTLLSTIANKIVNEGSNSGGLNIITQLQACWQQSGLDHSVKLPANHAKWYFDAVQLNADDKQLSSRIRTYNGRHWQEYFARQATVMEKWYKGGQHSTCTFTVVNNIGKKVPYVVFASEGKIYQKAVGGGMIGNSREVWRHKQGLAAN